MSLLQTDLQRRLFRGEGVRSPSKGAIPVLFGLKFIRNPRIVWLNTSDLPIGVRVTGSSEGEIQLRVRNAFVLLTVLCHGVIDDVIGIWCNDARLYSASRAGALSATGTGSLQHHTFREFNFFSNEGVLEGAVAYARGDDNTSLIFTKGRLPELYPSYMRDTTTGTLHSGLALATLYVEQQNSDNFNNWSFLSLRYPKFETPWQKSLAEIKVAESSFGYYTQERPRDRHFIVAVDCSSINGIPIGAATPISGEMARRLPTPSTGSGSFNPAFLARRLIISYGRFTYRYDVIRESALALIDAFRKKLAESSIGYRWSLKVVLMHDNGLEQVMFTENGLNQDSVLISNGDNVTAFLNALYKAVQNHTFLRAATDMDELTDVFNGQQLDHSWRTINQKASSEPFRQLFAASINSSYKNFARRFFIGGRLRFNMCEYGDVFDFARTQPAFQSVSENVLPQICFITGPTWPAHLAAMRVIHAVEERSLVERAGDLLFGSNGGARFKAFVYPNIADLYDLAINSVRNKAVKDAGRESVKVTTSRFNVIYGWWYGVRVNPLDEISELRTAMGAATNWRFPDGLLQIRTDYRGIDPFCWGHLTRTTLRPSLTSYPFRSNTDWTVANAYPTYLSYLRRGIPPVPHGSSNTRPQNLHDISIVVGDTRIEETLENVIATTAGVDGVKNYVAGMAEGMGAETTKAVFMRDERPINTANPVHIIRECLLNKEWGRGAIISEDDLNDASFVKAARTLHNEEFGLGFLWDRQATLNEFINDVLRHIDAVLYERDEEIFIELVGASLPIPTADETNWRKPIGISDQELADAQTRVLDTNNIISVTDLKIPREDELINRVVVQYTPHYSIASFNVNRGNDSRIRRYGLKSKTIKYDGIIADATARRVAERDLEEEEAGLITCTVSVLPEDADGYNPNDIVMLKWPDIHIRECPFRIVSIKYGSTRANRTQLSLIQAHPANVTSIA